MLWQSSLTFVLLFLVHELVAQGDTKTYSYICVQDNQMHCLGVSPGSAEPVFVESNPWLYQLQIKQRRRAEYTATDYKKTRWDVRFDENLVSLSRFPDLCIALEGLDPEENARLGLFPCSSVKDGQRLGYWDMKFNTNVNEVSEMRLMGAPGDVPLCLSIMECENGSGRWCNRDSEEVDSDGFFRSGSYVKVQPCWDSSIGDTLHRPAQTFRQALDCAAGCSPFLQTDNKCDEACDNEACFYDNGRCATPSPTPPTQNPTTSPNTEVPSVSPTTSAPTSQAPTITPTTSPTICRMVCGPPTFM